MNVSIEKIEVVSFGKLKSVTVTPSAGINLLSAPNESGKSTLAAFIKFAFYGFAGARKQRIHDNEKKLYTPWDSELCSGALNIVADGVKYRIERQSFASGKETLSVTDRSTGKAVLAGECPGEYFFGVSEEVFSRTLFFRQLTVPAGEDELLAERLKNIAISASEQVSTDKAVKKLREARNEIKGKLSSGSLPADENELALVESQLTEALECYSQLGELSESISEKKKQVDDAQKKLERLKTERANIEKYDALMRLVSLKKLREEEDKAYSEYENARKTLGGSNDEESLARLFDLNSEYTASVARCDGLNELLLRAEAEKKELASDYPFDGDAVIGIKSELKKYSRLSVAFAVMLGAAAIGGAALIIAGPSSVGYLLLATALVAAVGFALFKTKPSALAREHGIGSSSELIRLLDSYPDYEKRISDAIAKCDECRKKYDEASEKSESVKAMLDKGIGEYMELTDSHADYGERLNSIMASSRRVGALKAHYDACVLARESAYEGVDIENLAENARGAKKPERDKALVDREINFYSQQYAINSEKLNEMSLTRVSLEAKSGDPAVLVGKRDALADSVKKGKRRFDALGIAIDGISSAADYMKSMVAPRIGERADTYFGIATDGAYGGFEVDTKLSMTFDNGFRRSCDYLSAGTRDSAYLSLRLALADTLFGGGGVPVVLDDAFAHIDDDRLVSVSKAILLASQKHQIFIFTHGDREEKALDTVRVGYTKITIEQHKEQ